MLSRVAQRVYWLGRYIERVENIARIINVNSNLLFDLPHGTRLGWRTLIEVFDNEENFLEKHNDFDERSVMRYLLADKYSPCSLNYSLQQARENARTTREILPSEAWEHVNDLHLFLKDNLADGLARKNRFYLLQNVISKCQQLTGLLSGTMSNNHSYEFIRIGRNLERSDMSTRLLDMGSNHLLPHLIENKSESDAVSYYQSILWMNILVSLSAYQMYRQHVQSRVSGKDVVAYILQDPEFPRAITHCLTEVQGCTKRLPKGTPISKNIGSILSSLHKADVKKLYDKGLHQFLDTIQLKFANLNSEIETKWFLD